MVSDGRHRITITDEPLLRNSQKTLLNDIVRKDLHTRTRTENRGSRRERFGGEHRGNAAKSDYRKADSKGVVFRRFNIPFWAAADGGKSGPVPRGILCREALPMPRGAKSSEFCNV